MNRLTLNEHCAKRYGELLNIMEKAQQEYASNSDAFENFNKLSVDLSMDRKKVLWVYLKKHLDGILTYLNDPSRASREPISGRISDAVVYLMILDAMIVEEDQSQPLANQGYMSQSISDMLNDSDRSYIR